MEESYKVSVIVPVYNTEKYLRDCINSLIRQTLAEIEIICIDDGSTDDSLKILEEYLNDDRITLQRQRNKGVSSARNTGMRLAQGEYLYFMDSDDLLLPDALERLYNRAKNDDLDILFFNGKTQAESKDYSGTAVEQNILMNREGSYRGIYSGTKIMQAFYSNQEYLVPVWLQFYRRDFCRKNKLEFYEGIIHEDNLFTYESILSASRCGYLNDSLYIKRVRPESITTTRPDFDNVAGYFICYIQARSFLAEKAITHKKRGGAEEAVLNKMLREARRGYELLTENEKLRYLNLPYEEQLLFKAAVVDWIEAKDEDKPKKGITSALRRLCHKVLPSSRYNVAWSYQHLTAQLQVQQQLINHSLSAGLRNEEVVNAIKDELQKLQGGQEELQRKLQALLSGQEETRRELQALQAGQEEAERELQALQDGQEEAQRTLQALQGGQEETRRELQALQSGQEETRRELQELKSDYIGVKASFADIKEDYRQLRQNLEQYTCFPEYRKYLFLPGTVWDIMKTDETNETYDIRDDEIKVTVIIPVYNKEKTLEQCLRSVVRQSLAEIQIICIDDGSTDGSLEILNRFKSTDARLVVESQQNSGAGSARNRGLGLAKGEYISFMDADDHYAQPYSLEILYYTAKQQAADICGGSISFFEKGISMPPVIEDVDYSFKEWGWIDYRDLQQDYYFQRFIYRRVFLEEHGLSFPDSRQYQDVVFMAKTMIAAGQVYAVSTDVYSYSMKKTDRIISPEELIYILRIMTEELVLSAEKGLDVLHCQIIKHLEFYLGSMKAYKDKGNMDQLFGSLREFREAIKPGVVKDQKAAEALEALDRFINEEGSQS